MSFSSSPIATASAVGANGTTTGAVDTSGADLLVVTVSDGFGAIGTVTDSKSNTWNALTTYTQGATGGRVTIYYAYNPNVGSGHTFTYAGANVFCAVEMTAWSGALLTDPFGTENGATTAGATSLSTGSVTPSEDNMLLISVLSFGASNTAAINSSFTISHQGNYSAATNYGGAQAYKVQSSAGAENPQWSWGASTAAAAAIATFKAAAGGGFIDNTSNILRALWGGASISA